MLFKKGPLGLVVWHRTDSQKGIAGVACDQAFSGFTGVVSRDPSRVPDLVGYGLQVVRNTYQSIDTR